MKKVILISGVTGFIGREVLSSILREISQVKVIGLCNRKPTRVFKRWAHSKKIDLIQVDFHKPKTLRKIPRTFETFIHLGGFVPRKTKDHFSRKNYKINVEGSRYLENVCLGNKKLKHIILSSSISVYGNHRTRLVEEQRCAPETPYAVSKWLSERIFKMVCRKKNIRLTILRYSSVYGAGQNPNTVIPVFIRSCLKKKPLRLLGKGNRYQDFVYVKDVAKANILALRKKRDTVYNIGLGRKTTMKCLARLVVKHFGNVRSRMISKKIRDKGTNQVMSIAKAKKELGFTPSFSPDQGLKDYAEQLRG